MLHGTYGFKDGTGGYVRKATEAMETPKGKRPRIARIFTQLFLAQFVKFVASFRGSWAVASGILGSSSIRCACGKC